MSLFRFVPVMWIPLVVYLAVGLIDGSAAGGDLAKQAMSMTLPSGDVWSISFEDLLVGFGLLCLSAELIRTARATNQSIVANMLVSVGFIIGLILLLLVPGFGTSSFFFILLMMLASFLMTSAILVFNARRTIDLAGGSGHHSN